MTDLPCISSFVIRIIEETDSKYAASPLRGTIRHIQSDEEISFTNWGDVESFIDQFIPLSQMTAGADQVLNEIDHDSLGRSE